MRSTVFLLSALLSTATARAAEPGAPPSPTPTPTAKSETPPDVRLDDSVVVRAVRAEDEVPVTKTDLGRAAIEALNDGRETPVLLQRLPSMTSYSEAGNGAGYSYFQLRGLPTSRVNMTLDGVPLNDPEETAVYFANFGDFLSAVDSIQVQRGVGTSTVGAPSYGGSINFASAELKDDFGLGATLAAGSFGTRKASATVQSGRFGPGIALYGRVTWQETDGFRDHSGVKQRSVYLGASWKDDRTFVKAFGFTGRERTRLAYEAVEPEILEHDPRFNPMAPEEVDAFGQDVAHVQVTRIVGDRSTLSAQVYYNGAQGALDLWNDRAARDYRRSYGIDGRFVGTTLAYDASWDALSLTLGVHANAFSRDHFANALGAEEYRNTGRKDEQNGFAKATWKRGAVDLYGDLQVRTARFRYDGAVPIGTKRWTFVSPKAGVRWRAAEGLSLYASVGAAGREPARNDLFAGDDDPRVAYDLSAVKPERVVDVEAGVTLARRDVEATASVYDMEFRNEIVQTGEQSELGYAIRRNAGRSFRRGLELDLRWKAHPRLAVALTANASWAHLSTWTQTVDVYDGAGAFLRTDLRTFEDVEPLLTPRFVLNPSVSWTPLPGLDAALLYRWQATSWLDNTNRPGLETPSFGTLDASVRVDLSRVLPAARARLRVTGTNLTNVKRVWPSGYSYVFATRSPSGTETLGGQGYFYPQATRGVVVALDLGL